MTACMGWAASRMRYCIVLPGVVSEGVDHVSRKYLQISDILRPVNWSRSFSVTSCRYGWTACLTLILPACACSIRLASSGPSAISSEISCPAEFRASICLIKSVKVSRRSCRLSLIQLRSNCFTSGADPSWVEFPLRIGRFM